MDLGKKGIYMFKDSGIIKQLPLNISLNEEATFAEFCWNGNELLKTQLYSTLNDNGEKHLHIWGNVGCGKSHLLQACCQYVGEAKKPTIYLPLALLKDTSPEILEGFDDYCLICIDDIDSIASIQAWEEALFHLYNRIRDNGKTILLTTSKIIPQHLPLGLPDLRSRLAWGLVLNLKELNDDDKVTALQSLAFKRGFKLTEPVCHYLLSRYTRNMHDLDAILRRLDEASLIAQRKITIPFLKKIISC